MLVFVWLALTICQASAEDWNSIWPRYQKSKPNGCTLVSVNMFLHSINRIDSTEGLYQVGLIFRQVWLDDRLAYDAPQDPSSHFVSPYQNVDRSKVWTPDTFFSNEVSGYTHSIPEDNSFVRILPSGEIHLSRRITLTLRCPMNLSNFPFDVQICSIRIESFAHTRNLMEYQWNSSQPVQLNRELPIPGFELRQYDTQQCHSRAVTGEYSCISVNFTLQRHWRHYLLQVFIPMTTLVFLGWLAFWIRESSARMLVLMLSFSLAVLGTQFLNNLLPHTNYIKMIDIFTGVGIGFIFAAIVETVVVFRRLPDHSKKSEKEDNIDLTARVVYPACYAGFVAIYSLSGLLR